MPTEGFVCTSLLSRSLHVLFFFLASVFHCWPQMLLFLARMSLFGQTPSLFGQSSLFLARPPSFWPHPGKSASYQSEFGPVGDYGIETRLGSSKSRCRKTPAPSKIRTLKVAKKRGGLAKKRHLWPKCEKGWPKKISSHSP